MKFLSIPLSFALASTLALGTASARMGIGYDMSSREILVGFGVAEFATLELGAAANWNFVEDAEDQFDGFASANLLWAMHHWQNLTGYLSIKGILSDITRQDFVDAVETETNEHEVRFTGFIGFEPEVTFWDHLAISSSFGLSIPVTPDFRINTSVPGPDLLSGLKVKWVW